jgi:1-deoxy-D-xylulose-5-phosphate synthase
MPSASDAFPLLRTLDSPAHLRALPETQLGEICKELREYLIRSVATRGGHFAAGLGTVELTVALHYVFDTPDDRLVWDVGHQDTTRSASGTRAPRSRRRSEWRSPRS